MADNAPAGGTANDAKAKVTENKKAASPTVESLDAKIDETNRKLDALLAHQNIPLD